MTTPLRPHTLPQCTACLRRYAFASFADSAAPATALKQQTRGKKKMVNASATVAVRLLKDLKTFGRRGHVLPISRGQMRNDWFPKRIAEYVTMPEQKTLRLKSVGMERDYQYGVNEPIAPSESSSNATGAGAWQKDIPGDIKRMSNVELQSASAFQKPEIDKLTPERSAELVEIFLPPRLDFYRQPIVEGKEPEQRPPPEPRRQRFSGAAADLLAARAPVAAKSVDKPLAIFGSVSTQDVLTAVRAALGNNDEAARVVLNETDIHFVDLSELEGAEAGRVKHIGDFSFEIKVRGLEMATRRTVRVIPQDL